MQNTFRIKYHCCPLANHEDEQLNIVCYDERCPQNKQFALMCSMCQEENIHNVSNHKTKNLKMFVKSVSVTMEAGESQNSSDSQGFNQLYQVSRRFKIFADQMLQVHDTIDQVIDRNQNRSNNNTSKILTKVENSSSIQSQNNSLQELRKSVNFQNESVTSKQQKYIDLSKYIEKFLKYSSQLDLMIKVLLEEIPNIESNSYKPLVQGCTKCDQSESKMVEIEMEIQRLKSQLVNKDNVVQQWKQKFQGQQGQSMQQLNSEVKVAELEAELQNQKSVVTQLKEQNSTLRSKNQETNAEYQNLLSKAKTLVQKYQVVNEENEKLKGQQQSQQKAITCPNGHAMQTKERTIVVELNRCFYCEIPFVRHNLDVYSCERCRCLICSRCAKNPQQIQCQHQ